MKFNGQALRGARQALGLSMHVLAAKAGGGPTTVFMLETGREKNPRLTTIANLAGVLGVSEAIFFAPDNQETDAAPADTPAAS